MTQMTKDILTGILEAAFSRSRTRCDGLFVNPCRSIAEPLVCERVVQFRRVRVRTQFPVEAEKIAL